MESPLLETRACPSCPGLIAGSDPHHLCFECLGDQDMAEAVPFLFAIQAGRMSPFAGKEDDEDFLVVGHFRVQRPWKSIAQVCTSL